MSLKEKDDDDYRPSDVESVKGMAMYVAEVDRPYAMKCDLGTYFWSHPNTENIILNVRPVNKCLQEECVIVHTGICVSFKVLLQRWFWPLPVPAFHPHRVGMDGRQYVSHISYHPNMHNYFRRHMATRRRNSSTSSTARVITCPRRICHSSSLRWTNPRSDNVGRHGRSHRT